MRSVGKFRVSRMRIMGTSGQTQPRLNLRWVIRTVSPGASDVTWRRTNVSDGAPQRGVRIASLGELIRPGFGSEPVMVLNAVSSGRHSGADPRADRAGQAVVWRIVRAQ